MQNLSKLNCFIFILAVFFAVFSRYYSLENAPPGLFYDEAYNVFDSIKSSSLDEYKLFYKGTGGREGLHVFLIGKTLDVINPETTEEKIFVARFVGATIGILTILGVFFLARLLFSSSDKASLIASLAMVIVATSFWHLNFSRIVFRGILSPFIQVCTLVFLLLSFQHRKIIYGVIASILFGLGLYTYIAYPPFGLVILYAFFYYFKKSDISAKRSFLLMGLFFVIPLIMGIPLIESHSFSRVKDLHYFREENSIILIIVRFLHNITASIYMLFVYGDNHWRHNISGMPLLTPLAMVGTLMAMFVKPQNNNEFYSRLKFLIIWYVASVIPMIMTNGGAPHALRAINGVIPVSIFAAYGLYKGILRYYKLRAVLSFLIVSQMLLTYYLYFDFWANHEDTKWWLCEVEVIRTGRLAEYEMNTKKYIIYNKQENFPNLDKYKNFSSSAYYDINLILFNFPNEHIKKKNNYHFISQQSFEKAYRECAPECDCAFIFLVDVVHKPLLERVRSIDGVCEIEKEPSAYGLFKTLKNNGS